MPLILEEFALGKGRELLLNPLSLGAAFQLLDLILRRLLEHHREVAIVAFDRRVQLLRQVAPEPALLVFRLLVPVNLHLPITFQDALCDLLPVVIRGSAVTLTEHHKWLREIDFVDVLEEVHMVVGRDPLSRAVQIRISLLPAHAFAGRTMAQWPRINHDQSLRFIVAAELGRVLLRHSRT